MAQSGHSEAAAQCLLLGVKQTYLFAPQMSAYDPKRTSAFRSTCKTCYDVMTKPRGQQ